MFKPGYYYLHVNGSVIWKPKIVVESDPQYFESNMVVSYWKVESKRDYDNMITKAKDLNAGV